MLSKDIEPVEVVVKKDAHRILIDTQFQAHFLTILHGHINYYYTVCQPVNCENFASQYKR
jgi:hypothetical protein